MIFFRKFCGKCLYLIFFYKCSYLIFFFLPIFIALFLILLEIEKVSFFILFKTGVLLVVPLDLAITPMRVLQDPLLGPECRKMFEEGDVDDRFLMMLLLTVEHLRKNSLWKPYVWLIVLDFVIQSCVTLCCEFHLWNG